MPVMVCTLNGKPGYKWGSRGKCYTYTAGSETSRKRARSKAAAQGVAVKLSQGRTDAIDQAALEQLQRKRGELGITKVGRRPPQWLYPTSAEVKYRGILKRLVDEWAKQVRSSIVSHLPLLVDEAALEQPRTDASPAQVARLIGNLRVSMGLSLEGYQYEAEDIGQRTSDWNDQQWQKIMRSVVGVELFQREPWLAAELESFVAQNVDLITKLKDDTVAEVARVVQTGLREGKRVETIRKELMSTTLPSGVFNKVRNRARLIARDQVGKLNGDLQRLRQTNLGIEEYVWRTVGDERVRDSHRAMDGRRCRWDNPNVYYDSSSGKWLDRANIGGVKLHPGRDFQCRCSGEPVLEGVETELAPLKPVVPSRRRRRRAKPKPKPAPERKPSGILAKTTAGKEVVDFFFKRRKRVPVKKGVPQFFKPGTQQQALAAEIYDKPVEHIGMWRADGGFIGYNTDGKKAEVSLPREFLDNWRKLPASVEFHNHPSGSAFSAVDIWGGMMRATKDTFVVGRRAMYHFHIDNPVVNAAKWQQVKGAYRRAHTNQRRQDLKLMRSGKETWEQNSKEHWHRVAERVARQFDFLTYVRTPIEGA